jgi:hypothetical protein
MENPDALLFTRHATARIRGNLDNSKIAVSTPEVMARIEPVFERYTWRIEGKN